MSKPVPPLPPQELGDAVAKAAAKPAAARRKAPPMMLQCASAMGAHKGTVHRRTAEISSSSSRCRNGPKGCWWNYVG